MTLSDKELECVLNLTPQQLWQTNRSIVEVDFLLQNIHSDYLQGRDLDSFCLLGIGCEYFISNNVGFASHFFLLGNLICLAFEIYLVFGDEFNRSIVNMTFVHLSTLMCKSILHQNTKHFK